MTTLEGIALWAGITAYTLAVTLLAAAAFFDKAWQRRWGGWLAVAAVGLHAAAIVTRWAATGHAPVMGVYENSLTGSWFVAAIGGAAALRFRPAVKMLPAALGLALLVLGNGVMAPATLAPLEPPFRSNWLVVHVAFAWLGFGSYLVVSLLAVWYLWLTRAGAEAAGSRGALLDEVTVRLVAFGFVTHTVMIGAGAIWAHGLWGRYWGWDPIETWSLVCWLLYAVYLHLRFTLGWKGRRAGWLAIGAAAGIVVTFFGIGVVSNVHTALL